MPVVVITRGWKLFQHLFATLPSLPYRAASVISLSNDFKVFDSQTKTLKNKKKNFFYKFQFEFSRSCKRM